MCKYAVLFLLVTLSINYASAFESNLKMNKPKTIIAGYEGRQRHNRVYPRHCRHCDYNNSYLSRNDLNALEKYSLNRTYKRDSDLARLERLENLAFGATQTGNLENRYNNVENAILSRPRYGTKNSVLGNIANFFAGTATGYTPSITENYYSPMMNLPAGMGFSNNGINFYPSPGYMNRNFENYSNGPFSGGWGMSEHNYGTGSSVKILD